MIVSYLVYFLLFLLENDYNFELYIHGRNKSKLISKFGDLNDSRVHFVDFSLVENIPDDYEFDYIIHGASPAGTYYFINNPVEVIEPNVLGTFNLINKLSESGKFVFLSSNAIYGVSEKMELSERDYGIVDPLGECACYIEAKRLAEQLCVSKTREYNINTGIVRICHTYGPTFDIINDKRIVPKSIKKILDGENIQVYRDDASKIQYTYVADIVMAIITVMINGKPGEAYNACGEEIVTINEMIKLMIKNGEKENIQLLEVNPDNNYSFSKTKGVNFSKLNNNKLKAIGWKQLYNLDLGTQRMMHCYING